MKSSETALVAFLVGAAFMISVLAVDYLMINGPFARFFARTMIQAALYMLIYFGFETSDLRGRIERRGNTDGGLMADDAGE